MLDLEVINETITELEQCDDTNFSVCEKLAILYIVREHYEPVIAKQNVTK